MTKLKPAQNFKMIRIGRPSSSRYHRTCSPLADEGADNHEVSPHATRPLSLTVETRFFRGLGRKTLTSLGKVQMTMLVSACYQTLESDGRNETFSRSRLEDTNISGKGVDDYVNLCVLPDP